jgi:hypothetical protein
MLTPQERIDFLGGDVEMEMSPEDLQSHGALKAEAPAVLHELYEIPPEAVRFVAPAAGFLRARVGCRNVFDHPCTLCTERTISLQQQPEGRLPRAASAALSEETWR